MMRSLTPYEHDRLHTLGYLVIRLYQAASDVAAGEDLVASHTTDAGATAPLFPITPETLAIWRRMALQLVASDLARDAATAAAARQLLDRIRTHVPAHASVPDHWLL